MRDLKFEEQIRKQRAQAEKDKAAFGPAFEASGLFEGIHKAADKGRLGLAETIMQMDAELLKVDAFSKLVPDVQGRITQFTELMIAQIDKDPRSLQPAAAAFAKFVQDYARLHGADGTLADRLSAALQKLDGMAVTGARGSDTGRFAERAASEQQKIIDALNGKDVATGQVGRLAERIEAERTTSGRALGGD